jgi:glycosyltransferase involved in cell wall biosynthesis
LKDIDINGMFRKSDPRMTKISVFIIVKDEEKNIGRCLESVRWADEIVVVDSCSTDSTVEICRKYTDKVYINEFTDYAGQKNFALSKTTGNWALSIDADEEVTPELRKAIEKVVLEDNGDISGYFIKRRSCIFGRWFKFCGTQDDYQIRLFRKGRAEYYQPIHEKIRLEGASGVIEQPLLHYTYDGATEYIDRLNVYTTMEAGHIMSAGKIPRIWDFVLRPVGKFIKLYFLKQGFRDGMEGFLFSALSGYYDLVKYAKLHEMIKKNDL